MPYQVNIRDIESAVKSLGGEAKAKKLQDHILSHHCGGRVPTRYQDEKSFRQTIQRKIEDYCPDAAGFALKDNEPKFRRVGHGIYRIIENPEMKASRVSENKNNRYHTEGAAFELTMTAYERDPRARAACLAHYGVACSVCCINFERTYGEIGKGFIHVHHLRPLASVGRQHETDPIQDLRPVCPNCHAMLHKTSPPLTITELRARLK